MYSVKVLKVVLILLPSPSHFTRDVPVLLLHPDDALYPAVQLADVRHELVVELEAFGGLDEKYFDH